MVLGSHQGPSTPALQGQQFVVGQRLKMPVPFGAPSSSRKYMTKSSAHIQAIGVSYSHCLPGQHAHPSVHGTNDPEGLGQYVVLLMSEDADVHAYGRAVAVRGRRVQGHTRF